MQNKPTISVIIPTYNRADTLIHAVNSVLNQTYPVSEIFVCDDGSSDNSKQLINELKNPKITWLDCGRNGMPAIPRNIGIKKSTSEWIAFLDSDDEWLPEKIEEQISCVIKTGYKAACSNAFRIVENSDKTTYLTITKQDISFEDLLPVNYVICSSMMVHRSIFETVKGFPESKEFKAIEDYCLWLKIATLTPIVYVNKPLVNYFDNPNESIRAKDKSVLIQRKLIFEELIKWLHSQSLFKKEDYIRVVKYALNEPKRNFRKQLINKLKNFVKRFLRK